MELCVVSGKGGTGKTTVSVGLAVALADQISAPVRLVDCDVEAPNCHLYLNPGPVGEEPVTVLVPAWEREKCAGCGDCAKACQFAALGLFGAHLEIFTEHCHSCGVCVHVCPEGSLSEVPRRIGVIRRGAVPGIELSWGLLDVGEPRAVPVIDALRSGAGGKPFVIVDGPPGTSCSMAAAARRADAALVVTEPTPFGLHDLAGACAVLQVLGVPAGVVLNKAQGGRGPVHEYCEAQGLPLLLEIPMDRALAESGAAGVALPAARPEYGGVLRDLWAACEGLAAARTSP